MRSLLKLLLCGAVLALAAGCASGPKFTEIRSAIPPLAKDQGRIYFYRSTNPFGSGIRPDVMLNGAKVGESIAGGFFFVDQKPGPQEVNLSTEVERKVTFTLDAGQTRYVRMQVGLGVIIYRVFPELADPAEGAKEMQELSYTGKPLSGAARM